MNEAGVDIDIKIQARLDASAELYSSCIVKAKDIIAVVFGEPKTYYDGEKKHVLDIAQRLFDSAIFEEDISLLSESSMSKIRVATMDNKPSNLSNGDQASTSNKGLCGF